MEKRNLYSDRSIAAASVAVAAGINLTKFRIYCHAFWNDLMWEKKRAFCRITSPTHSRVTIVCYWRFKMFSFHFGMIAIWNFRFQEFHTCAAVFLQCTKKNACCWVLVLATFNEVHSSRATLRFCIQLTFRMESTTAVGYPQWPWPPQRHLRLQKQNTKVHQGSFIPLQGQNLWRPLSPYSLCYFQCDH